MESEWKSIDSGYTYRMKVPGGWIVKVLEDVTHNRVSDGMGMASGWDFRVALVYVPDPTHEWWIG